MAKAIGQPMGHGVTDGRCDDARPGAPAPPPAGEAVMTAWQHRRGAMRWGTMALTAATLAVAGPACAEIATQTDQGFVSRNAVVVSAGPEAVWKRLVTPGAWWSSDHTFSGDAANMTIDPVPGGCFCEKLPGEAGPAPKTAKPGTVPRPPARGGVEHMRVVFVDHARALRMIGALGPLQSEAVSATLTITVKPVEGGTRVLFEYVVGGFMRYPANKIAPAVDSVMAGQLTSLASALGPVGAVSVPMPGAAPAKPGPDKDGPPPRSEEQPPAGQSGQVQSGQGQSGLGREGLILPRGRVWSLPPSQPGAAPPAEPAPVVAPLPEPTPPLAAPSSPDGARQAPAMLPTAILPPDVAATGTVDTPTPARARPRPKAVPAKSASGKSASGKSGLEMPKPAQAEPAQAEPVKPKPVKAAPAPDAVPPAEPAPKPATRRKAARPAGQTGTTAAGQADEPTRDTVNSAFDSVLGAAPPAHQ
eukprot:gene3650-3699_t